MNCTFLTRPPRVLLPVNCLVVCAFIILEQRLRGLSHLKTPWCFIFSLPLLEKKCFVAERFTVKQSTLHSSASWPFSSLAVLGENGPGSAMGLGGDWRMGGSQQLQLP